MTIKKRNRRETQDKTTAQKQHLQDKEDTKEVKMVKMKMMTRSYPKRKKRKRTLVLTMKITTEKLADSSTTKLEWMCQFRSKGGTKYWKE